MTRSLSVCALLLLAACKIETTPLPEGQFTFAMADPADAVEEGAIKETIEIDLEAETLRIVSPDGAAEEFALDEHFHHDSYTDCYTNYDHATMDTYEILGEVELGGLSFEVPTVSSKCGSGLLIGSWNETRVNFDGPVLHFDEVE